LITDKGVQIKMKIKHYAQLTLVSALLTTPLPLLAGNLEPSAAPTSYSGYTLQDICNRLDDGTAGAESTFQEPTAAPGSTGCTLNEVMDKVPVVDDTDGAATTEVLSGKKYWGLTNGEWGLQTGTAPPAPVHATSETGSTGVAWPNPRFTINTTADNNSDGDCDDEGETCAGTVTDNLTGLIWLANANCTDLPGTDANGKANWSTAKTAASGLTGGTCGLPNEFKANDWRLPSVNELQSLAHYGFYDPAVPNTVGTAKWTTDGQPFSGVQSGYYWAATTYASDTSFAWFVHLEYGDVFTYDEADTFYVWPVRGRP
jgi:hypothetical protein